MLMNIPESFASNVLPSQQATFTPVFPGGLQELQSGLTQIPMETDLPWGPVHVNICVHLLRMGSPFPPVLWSSCAQALLAFNARCSRGSFSQCRIPTRESLMCGSELPLL